MEKNSVFRVPFLNSSSGGESVFKFRTVRVVGRKRKWVSRGMADVWLFMCLAIFVGGCYGYQEQRFAMEPQDQSAIIGSRVTLPCRVENKVGALQWTKDDFGLGTHRNLSGYERYKMIGSDEEGDYSLDIRDIKLEDDGQYQCQVSSGLNGEPAIRSRYAQLSVLVAPEPPRIIQGAFIDAVENQPVDIECVSVGGKPAAEITWVTGNQVVIKKDVQTKIEQHPDGQRFTTRSVLRLSPSKDYHNQTITCQAQNTADRAYRMATVHIEVKYAPKLKVSLKSGAVDGKIPEGAEVRIHCDVDANPQVQLYRWFINDNLVVGDYAEEMIIFNVTRKYKNAEVKCEVSNAVAKSEEKITLEVTFPPSFKTRPYNIESEEGASVTLNCDVEGYPTPEIRWLFHEPGRIGQVKGKEPTLDIANVNQKTAGRYICKATVPGYPEIETEATVFIKGEPKIISNTTQFGTEGESVKIDCAALSVPKPDDIRWFFEGKEISAILNPEYATIEKLLPDGLVMSSLVIRSSKSHHFGQYNCSITNEYGNANSIILLKPTKTLPLFIILSGVTSGIIIVAAFVVLVIICHRKTRKSQNVNEKPDVTVTNGDLYKDSDRSSNISDLKPQLHSDGTYDLEYTSSETSNTKLGNGLPLAGPVPLSIRHDDPLLRFRYSNDYSDPVYNDDYFKNAALGGYLYDYQGYPPPPTLRVQSPNPADLANMNRSLQGSLTRSIDTTSTLPLSNGSQNNSLKKAKSIDEPDAINNLGLPVGSDTPPTPIYTQPNKNQNGVDMRYAATYGNPYLRNSLGFANPMKTSKSLNSAAPPPYSAVRNSVVVQGAGNPTSQATHV